MLSYSLGMVKDNNLVNKLYYYMNAPITNRHRPVRLHNVDQHKHGYDFLEISL